MFKIFPKKFLIFIIILVAIIGGVYLTSIPLTIGVSGGSGNFVLPDYSLHLPGLEQTISYPLVVPTGSTTYCSNCFTYLNGSLTVNYNLFLKQGDRMLSGGDSVCPGDKIDLGFNKDGEWWVAGGLSDSPPAYWVDKTLVGLSVPAEPVTYFGYTYTPPPTPNPETVNNFKSLPSGGCEDQNYVPSIGGNVHWTHIPLMIQNPTTSLVGTGSVNCSVDTCIVGKDGEQISVTGTVNKTYFQQVLAQYYNNTCNYNFSHAVFLPIEPVSKTWNLNIASDCKIVDPLPIVTEPSSTPPDWCESPFQYLLSWKVNTTQKEKQIQVSTNSNFSGIIYDSGKVSVAGNITSYALPAIGHNLEYNKTYYWRVRVWNSNDVASVGWSAVQTITTPKHQYPEPSFTKDLVNPKPGETIKFADTSTVSVPVKSRLWTFEDGTPLTSALRNPSVVFNNAGKKTISLNITDVDGYSCTISSTSNSGGASNYQWREVAP